MLDANMRESITNEAVVDDIDGPTMMELLRFIYCQKIGELIDDVAVSLLYAAEKYDLKKLKKICSYRMAMALDVSNVLETLKLADLAKSACLKETCMDFIKW